MRASWQEHHTAPWLVLVLTVLYVGILAFPLVRHLLDRRQRRRMITSLTNADLYRAAKRRRAA